MKLEQKESDRMQVKLIFQGKAWHRNTGYVS